MIERTSARQWLLIAAAGVVVLGLYLLIPTADLAVAVVGAVLALGGIFGLAWRLLGDR